MLLHAQVAVVNCKTCNEKFTGSGNYCSPECDPAFEASPPEKIVILEPKSQSSTGGPKFDGGKLLYSLIPPVATHALAEVLTFGANKYAPDSWQSVEDGERRYTDALMRHLESYRSGEAIDPDSGLSHLKHLICNAAFLLHFEEERLKFNEDDL